jgi:hypothetical protein
MRSVQKPWPTEAARLGALDTDWRVMFIKIKGGGIRERLLITMQI